jgi:hypothetical protein
MRPGDKDEDRTMAVGGFLLMVEDEGSIRGPLPILETFTGRITGMVV